MKNQIDDENNAILSLLALCLMVLGFLLATVWFNMGVTLGILGAALLGVVLSRSIDR